MLVESKQQARSNFASSGRNPMTTLIKNGQIATASKSFHADLLIADEKNRKELSRK